MSILVTGCSGFIGSHLCEKLIELGCNVIGIDINDLPDDFKYKDKLIFEKEDIRIHVNSISKYNPDIIIHLAALAGVYSSTQEPQNYVTTNIIGTVNILEEAKRCGVNKIIYASSSTVYANENNKETFNTPSSLLSPYAITKKSCEMLFDYYDCKCIGLRFFSVYGPRGRKDMAPYIFINKILNNEIISIYGTGNTRRDFTYISDIIDGIVLSIKLINEKDFKHKVFNLGNSRSVTIKHFLSVIEKVTEKKANIRYLEKRECDSEITHADLSKAHEILNYNPIVSLEDGVKKTVQWHLM
jgi:UDP-glucuronate 4-epimerase